jgi:dipeptidyl aminopeptidase/acylaminoacyl peptidase
MNKILISVILLVLVVPTTVSSKQPDSLKAAFIRSDDLWIKDGEKELKITNGEFIRYPKWSYNGEWVAYLKGIENDEFPLYKGSLWIYNLKTKIHTKVKDDVRNHIQWSPMENTISFQVGETLYTMSPSLSKSATPIASKVKNFSWLPNGHGLVVSTIEENKPNSGLILSKITLTEKNKKPFIKRFFSVPIDKSESYVSTSKFEWSYDKKWISFLLVPTASLSADSNTLCILSSDGKKFYKKDEMLHYEDWIDWSPYKNQLGYITGVGREADTNKQLKIASIPPLSTVSITPKGYIDRGLTWQNSRSLYVSRSRDRRKKKAQKSTLPSLYKVNLTKNKQTILTNPSANEGDFEPQIEDNKLVWIRTDRKSANVLVTPTYQFNESVWINNISVSNHYYEKWNWGEVFSLYKGR